MGWTQAQQNQADEQIKNHFCSHHILARVTSTTSQPASKERQTARHIIEYVEVSA
eukprot:jgi/Antlo1/364/696